VSKLDKINGLLSKRDVSSPDSTKAKEQLIAVMHDSNNDSNNDTDIDIDIDDENNGFSNNEIDITETDAIDAILDKTKSPNDKVFKGFYLEPKIAKVLEKLAKKHGKGIQSQIVNEALRQVFVSKDLL